MRKIPRNLVEILSDTCLYNLFETYFSYWGYLLAVNLQIYLRLTLSLKSANNIRLCCKKLGTSHDVKGFAFGSFLERKLLLKEQMMTSVRKSREIWLFLPQPVRSPGRSLTLATKIQVNDRIGFCCCRLPCLYDTAAELASYVLQGKLILLST